MDTVNLDKLMSGKLRPAGRPRGSKSRRRSRRGKGRPRGSRNRSKRASRRGKGRPRGSRNRRRSKRASRSRSKRASRSRSKRASRSRSKRASRRRSRSGRRNPQAAAAMRIMRSEGISLKAAWAKVKGGKGRKTKYQVTRKSINKHFNKKQKKSSPKKYSGPKMKLDFGLPPQPIPGF